MKKHKWIYLTPKTNIKTDMYLCYRENARTSEKFFLDVYVSSRKEWVFKHPLDSYTAIIPIRVSDVVWQDGVPTEHDWYMIQNEGRDNMWIDWYGELVDKDFNFTGEIGWKFNHFPIAKWAKFPFIDLLYKRS